MTGLQRFAVAVAVAASIGGCSQIAQWSANDAATAAQIDPAHKPCYDALGVIAQGLAAAQMNANSGLPQVGLISAVATDMAIQAAIEGPCAPIAAKALTMLVRASVPIPTKLLPLLGIPG